MTDSAASEAPASEKTRTLVSATSAGVVESDRRLWPSNGHREDDVKRGVEGTEPAAGQRRDAQEAKRRPKFKHLPRIRLEILGSVMTGVGLLLLLFLLYFYAFTSLSASRNQERLLHQLSGNPKQTYALALGRRPPNGSPVAILDIPALRLHQAVVEGTTPADLQLGPGLASESVIPGRPGTSVIAGRRTSYGAPFGNLHSLVPRDRILVTDGAGHFTFSVVSVRTIPAGTPYAVATLGHSWVTLVTSDSSFLPSGHLVVVARLNGLPAGQGGVSPVVRVPPLNGDPWAIVPTLLWTLAFLGVLGVMVVGMRRWHQPALSYLLAIPVLVACGLFACESFARILPATL
ncbi:MAG TPA: class E sortase [Acidimicrobiales bacterium]|nr:class E sortase [Acidimicrobiales bacterium]